MHCDCNSYFASVECINRPELKSVPMAVCGDPKNRHGIILAKNEPAKAYGVQTAETIWQAKKKCPNLTLITPHHNLYSEYSKKINEVYACYTDQVEAFSVDESWLDVTGSRHLFGTGKQIADALRARVEQEFGLTISVGVSYNKIFAKMGSDYKKPNATTVITRENYQALLWPLPARDLFFVGRAAAGALDARGIRTIGDIAAAGKERMKAYLGRMGVTIWEYASGLDSSPVRKIGNTVPPKSVGNSITFARDLSGIEDIRSGLLMLTDQVGTRLRAQRLYGTTVQVMIKDPSLSTISRQRKLPAPSNSTKELFEAALAIVTDAWPINAPIRMLSVTAANLTDNCAMQTNLFADPEQTQRRAKLDSAVDSIRARYGQHAVAFGRTMHSDIVDHTESTKE